MTDHIQVNDNFVAALVESAAWGAARLNVAEKKVQEATEVVEEHTCPLCESSLEEEITDEAILDHLDMVSELLEAFAADEDAEALDEEDDLEEDVEEERGDKKGDKSNVKADADDEGDYTTDQRKGDKSKTHPGKKDFMKKMKGKTEKAC